MNAMSAEAQVLHAVLSNDIPEAQRRLSEFTKHELDELQSACIAIDILCDAAKYAGEL